MGKDPWRVAVASMLLCRTRRLQAEPALRNLLTRWPTAADLSRAHYLDVEPVVRLCGLQRNRARQLGRFSVGYLADWWSTLDELPGVGLYVADAVGLFCLGCTELATLDRALHDHVRGTVDA